MAGLDHIFVIEPLSPLVLRGGRPFGVGESAETLPFPWPSTVAGALRSAYAVQQGWSFANQRHTDDLLKTAVCGPLLACIDYETDLVRVALPKPHDAIYQPGGKVVRLSPRPLTVDPSAAGDARQEWLDLPDDRLEPVLASEPPRFKSPPGPTFWHWDSYRDWLAEGSLTSGQRLGTGGLPVDVRTHVVRDRLTGAERPEGLFSTAGLDFGPQSLAEQAGWGPEGYGLLASTDFHLDSTIQWVGGEGRMSRIDPATNAIWPTVDEALQDRLSHCDRIRMILATPAIFSASSGPSPARSPAWYPAWLGPDLIGSPPGTEGKVTLRLVAAVLDRWQPISGWDLRTSGRRGARAIRRAVPAGAVYWFDVIEGRQHLSQLWLKPMSDGELDRKAGFGAVLIGVA